MEVNRFLGFTTDELSVLLDSLKRSPEVDARFLECELRLAKRAMVHGPAKPERLQEFTFRAR